MRTRMRESPGTASSDRESRLWMDAAERREPGAAVSWKRDGWGSMDCETLQTVI
jgi:hypothetical protein